MLLALQVLLGFFALLLLYLSSQWAFATRKIAKEHQIEFNGTTGANYLKGDIGGVLLTGAVMAGLFLFHDKLWFYPIVLMLICVILHRLLSLMLDGYSKQGVIAIVVELIMIALGYGIFILQ